MNTGLIVAVAVIIVLVAAVALAAAFAVPWQRSRRLRRRFGPEYDRAVQELGGRRAAERELAEREKRHAKLDLKPLSEDSRRQYRAEWDRIQERFVDSPPEAVREGHELLSRLMADRGYPTEDDDQRIADLSVEHAGTVDRYRKARAIGERSAAGEATTEDMRAAMVDYRALFHELLGNGSAASTEPETADRGDSAAR
ncbi:hypothetical protein FZ103_11120 [Streptomonospora sp. PA3]|uniref:hypothetical protein n=1 Tax=Streptomonospora sp. PA3 TaxID=2607326 RepID=UPI0012DF2D72|nr:hypothetical protein [Streptomonospora sp. PA3]MUL41717.1 hypothetical protein [Streptomonospora sp. PA3]